jgi:serine phosphatase RsbU (regulator of sigma subunit)
MAHFRSAWSSSSTAPRSNFSYPGDRLLLLSDGVPEATDPDDQLFGFDRVLELLRARPTAASIAETAQAFGQDDDISVIAVTRMAAQPALV